MKRSLLILGAGQFGTVTKEIAEAMGIYDRIEFLDDNAPAAIGKLSDLDKFREEFTDGIVAIDDIMIRMSYLEKLLSAGYTVPVIKHPTCYVSPSAVIGEGSILEPNSAVHTASVLGRGCILSLAAVVNHHTIVGDFCHIACNSTVMQNTRMASCTDTVSGQLFFAEPAKYKPYNPVRNDYSFDSGM